MNLLRLALECLRVGTFAFGGGFVMIPLMEQAVVHRYHWLTPRQFVDAVALGQMTPGPLLVTATFIGYKVSGLLGATLATVCIFLPSCLMTIAASRQLDRLRGNVHVQAFLRGVNASVLGLVASAAVTLARTSMGTVPTALLGLASLAILLKWRMDPAIVIIAAGLIAFALRLVPGQ